MMQAILKKWMMLKIHFSDKLNDFCCDFNSFLFALMADLELILNEKQRYKCCYVYLHNAISAAPQGFIYITEIKLAMCELALASEKGGKRMDVQRYNTTCRRVQRAYEDICNRIEEKDEEIVSYVNNMLTDDFSLSELKDQLDDLAYNPKWDDQEELSDYFDLIAEKNLLEGLFQAMCDKGELPESSDVDMLEELYLGGGLVVSCLMHCWNVIYPNGNGRVDLLADVSMDDLANTLEQVLILLRVKFGHVKLPQIPL